MSVTNFISEVVSSEVTDSNLRVAIAVLQNAVENGQVVEFSLSKEMHPQDGKEPKAIISFTITGFFK